MLDFSVNLSIIVIEVRKYKFRTEKLANLDNFLSNNIISDFLTISIKFFGKGVTNC